MVKRFFKCPYKNNSRPFRLLMSKARSIRFLILHCVDGESMSFKKEENLKTTDIFNFNFLHLKDRRLWDNKLCFELLLFFFYFNFDFNYYGNS